jgi:hypothetical protein
MVPISVPRAGLAALASAHAQHDDGFVVEAVVGALEERNVG